MLDKNVSVGSNMPPLDLLVGEALREKLRDENQDLIKRCEELLAAADRIPGSIDDEQTAMKGADFSRQLSAAIKQADVKRVGAKEPYLEGGRNIDGFFTAISNPLERAKAKIGELLTIYQRTKAEAERRRREDEERRRREEAERLAREAAEAAAKVADEKSLQAAIEQERVAKEAVADVVKANVAAEAKSSELSRTRGEYGAVASLRTYWTFSDIDRAALDLDKLRMHIPLDALERAVRAYIKVGGRELRGVKIFETTDSVVR